MKYLSAEQVLFIHSRLIDATGGAHGLRDTGLLKSAVSRPRATFAGKELYPDIYQKAASLFESLIKNHPFLDGNKRTAITSASLFLQLNGCRLKTNQKELERFTLEMAVHKEPFHDAVAWFQKNTSRQ